MPCDILCYFKYRYHLSRIIVGLGQVSGSGHIVLGLSPGMGRSVQVSFARSIHIPTSITSFSHNLTTHSLCLLINSGIDSLYLIGNLHITS